MLPSPGREWNGPATEIKWDAATFEEVIGKCFYIPIMPGSPISYHDLSVKQGRFCGMSFKREWEDRLPYGTAWSPSTPSARRASA